MHLGLILKKSRKMFDLLPEDISVLLFQEWIDDVKDLSNIDRALCNKLLRAKFLTAKKSVQQLTINYNENHCISDVIAWLSSRNITPTSLSVMIDYMTYSGNPFPWEKFDLIQNLQVTCYENGTHHPVVTPCNGMFDIPEVLSKLLHLKQLEVHSDGVYIHELCAMKVHTPSTTTFPLETLELHDLILHECTVRNLFGWLNKHCLALTTLVLSECDHVEPDCVLNYIPTFTQLELVKYIYKDCDNLLTEESTCFPNLLPLSFPLLYSSRSNTAPATVSPCQITKLELGNVTNNHAYFYQLLKQCPHLKELCIHGLDFRNKHKEMPWLISCFVAWKNSLEVVILDEFCNDIILLALCEVCPNIKYLEIQEFASITNKGLIGIVKSLTQLETLHLEQLPAITDAGIKSFCELAKSNINTTLVDLSIKSCLKLSEKALHMTITTFPKLTTLEIALTECMSCNVMSMLRYLANQATFVLKYLEALTFVGRSDCIEMKGKQLEDLLNNCEWNYPNLHSISLTSIVLSESSFQKMLKTCSRLMKVECSIFVNFSKKSVGKSTKKDYKRVNFLLFGTRQIEEAQQTDMFLKRTDLHILPESAGENNEESEEEDEVD